MEPERWHRVDNILQAALALNPAERSTFVDSACEGDESLRDEVRSLLSLDDQEPAIIDAQAIEVAAPLLASNQPDLFDGQFVGHYKIVALLGIGGMGEVYLAEDTKLGRKIAVKLLPADFSRDHDRVRRFQQEARAASALNHPNIVTIHETGEFEDRHFIAAEFIEGETLRERIRRAPLNLGETLDIAIQAAGALAASHQAGIVHRDIKPENIMLRPDGYVKVLDFGLAKLAEQAVSNGGSDASTNQTDTTPGLLLGTVKYMSPEQARGLNLDARSDIFSLGVVVYEMLAGRPPFDGDTNSDVIAALLKEDPAPLSQFVPEIPAELEQIVNKALAKNSADRYQTTDDLLSALRDLRRELEAEQTLGNIRRDGSNADISRTTTTPLRSDPQKAITNPSITQRVVNMVARHKVQAGVAFLIAIAAVGGFFYRSKKLWRTRAAFQEVKVSELVEADKSRLAAISPDGGYVAETLADGNRQSVVLTFVATNSRTVLVPPSEATFNGVTFSRDGNYVYYGMWGKDDPEYALYRVPVSGGDRERILANVGSQITFSPDGNRFAFVRALIEENTSVNGPINENGLFIASTDGTGERLLAKRIYPNTFGDGGDDGPSWSPDGKAIACAVANTAGMNVAVITVEDGTEKLLGPWRWSSVGQVEWLSDNSGLLMVAKVKGEDAERIWFVSYPDGNSRRLPIDTGNYRSISLTADSSVFVASRSEVRTNLWTAPGRDTSQIRQITFGGNHSFRWLAWTPDGKIVFPSDASGSRDIWIMEGDGTGQKRLTADGGTLPSVSPDGRYIAFISDRAGNTNIWRMNIDGSNPVQLTRGEQELAPCWSADSRWVLYRSAVSGKPGIWKVPFDGGEPIRLTREDSLVPAASPDGSLFACFWRSGGQPTKIAIAPLGGGEPIKFLDPLKGELSPTPIRWTSDGQSLIYFVTRNNISNIWSQPVDGGAPQQLTDFKSEKIYGFDWSRDDRLLVSRGFTAGEIVLIRDLGR